MCAAFGGDNAGHPLLLIRHVSSQTSLCGCPEAAPPSAALGNIISTYTDPLMNKCEAAEGQLQLKGRKYHFRKKANKMTFLL